MKIGLSNYTWPWAIGVKTYSPKKYVDLLNLTVKAKKYNVPVLQILDIHNLETSTDRQLNEIYSVTRKNCMTLEIGTRGIEPGQLLKYLEIAKKLNAKFIRSTTSGKLDHEAVSKIKEILPNFKKENICIAFENHDKTSTRELACFLDKIGDPTVGVCLDTVNSFAALESPEVVVRTLAPYTLSVHIKDFDIERIKNMLGFSIIGKPAGEGRLNVEWVIDYLKEKKRNDISVIVELWTPFTNTLEETIKLEKEWTRRSLNYLRTIIN